ncbi:LysE family translocator [Pelagibius sp. Alg239-R121]|uniref:LysE family translocator n=1 Tax=Pelagibius sp. Alg239-R121 TaxID=2993448 RepID=UPI0024A74534|nr:LysE family translocator [Pelagibius sp. Alg239-R121]
METLIAVAGLITVAAITPGPNNFIVLERTVRGGFRAGLPAIAGVMAGTQLLLLLIWLGAGALFAEEPRLRDALMLIGAGYLLWLGFNMVRQSFARSTDNETASLVPIRSFASLVLFQFLNPKSWVLVLTATAALSGDVSDLSTLLSLTLLFLVITGTCLTLWALMGAGLTHLLADQACSQWFDRAMGVLLIISAALLLT